MDNEGYLEKQIFDKLILDLADKYALELFEAREAIMDSLSTTYNFAYVSLSNKGTLIGAINNKKSKFLELKYYNISRKKYNKFLDTLHEKLYLKSSLKIEKKFSELIKGANNILYGKVLEFDDKKIKLKLFNKKGYELKNFYAYIDKAKLFKNEKETLEIGKGFLVFIPKRERMHLNGGVFSIKAVRKHNSIVRYFINSLFKDIKETLGRGYGYKKCIIDLNNKTITLFLNIYFSPSVKEYFEEGIKELDDFKVIYINKFKKG